MLSSPATHQLADLTLISEFPLPELPHGSAPATARSWRIRRGSAYPGPVGRWFHEWRESDGRLWLQIGRDQDGYVLRFAQWAAFAINQAAREIVCHAAADTPEQTVRHLLLNQVLPLLAAGPGRLVLHAAAVAHHRGAVGFVGASGSGKSTLCAALSRVGCTLLTDDALVLQRTGEAIDAIPTYKGVRLWPDAAAAMNPGFSSRADRISHYSEKVRVDVMPLAQRSVVLRRLCVLTAGGTTATDVHIESLRPRDAAVALMKYHFQLDVEDRAQLAHAFAMIADVIERVPVLSVTYPWRWDCLESTTQSLLDAVVAA